MGGKEGPWWPGASGEGEEPWNMGAGAVAAPTTHVSPTLLPQLLPPSRISRSDRMRSPCTPTGHRPSVTTVGRCSSAWCAKASSAMVRSGLGFEGGGSWGGPAGNLVWWVEPDGWAQLQGVWTDWRGTPSSVAGPDGLSFKGWGLIGVVLKPWVEPSRLV